MAVEPGMFLFEVVVGNVKSLVESRLLIIRSEFGDIFSLELKDPKTMNIVIPEPPPLPPEPPGKKKGKKKKPPGKKGKKGAEPLPPPEPVIQSGQSVLFTSTAEFLIQSMHKNPLLLSLWSKEDYLTYIGSATIPWDPIYITYLEKICNCEDPPPVTLDEEYNIFEEGTAKLMAKLGIQIKLSYLKDKVTTSFRALSEDLNIKKYLYTGINSKTTSYICTLKTSEEIYIENSNKIENNYVVDKPKPNKVVYADFKNAPGANLTFFNEGDYCCMKNADKPPESIYKSPETLPDIDFIVDYVRKIIVSCNDNMRMLTPRPTIRPRVKATDIDRLCYCKESDWPEGPLADRFKNEAQSQPCALCINAGKKPEGSRGATFDIANIRGPCGRHDCRIARHLRAYIEDLVEEDNKEININEIIGPCGSKSCTLAEKIQQFLRHDGIFGQSATVEGLSTQCACIKQMHDALKPKRSCKSICSKDCIASDSSQSKCDGPGCPYSKSSERVYRVNYFTVQYDFDINKDGFNSDSSKSSKTAVSEKTTGSSKFKSCHKECPTLKALEKKSYCSKSQCSSNQTGKVSSLACPINDETEGEQSNSLSPADSKVEIHLHDIHNQCCVKTCDVADKVKDFIVDNIVINKNRLPIEDSDRCLCDCDCTFKFSKATTYCAVCGGYECLGDDMKDQPVYAKPHPCPVYHKLYDKKYIKVESPWPDEEIVANKQLDNISGKSAKVSKHGTAKDTHSLERRLSISSQKQQKLKKETKTNERSNTIVEGKSAKKGKKAEKVVEIKEVEHPPVPVDTKVEPKYPYPPVPKTMGWNWVAEDVPGLKVRPKWKPGACNKLLVRRYRMMREGLDIIAKKKRALMQRKKKIEMKPTLIVKKQDGDYTVQMEIFKKYSKERLLFQYPYEEKPPLIYTIGKTEEEKLKVQKHKARRERRETRRKCKLLQSTFRDRCQEICLKAYNQAIGVLPFPNPNDPECPCYTADNDNVTPPIDSCSCSEDGSISSSDTDNDEWTIEFTPPAARWDTKVKHPPIQVDNECQYTYLDYKVKLLDKQGNQVPRFFIGPDGKQECSDLGGFFDPNKVWLEINKDGYIGPDNRWVPMNFTGPDGMYYSAEEGFFTDSSGQVLKIGIDGYIDKDAKWVWYSKRNRPKERMSKSTLMTTLDAKKSGRIKVDDKGAKVKSEIKSKTVIAHEKKTALAHKSPSHNVQKSVSYAGKGKGNVVMTVSVINEKSKLPRLTKEESLKLDPRKAAKYREITGELELYDYLSELKPPIKTNRASNTPRKRISPFTLNASKYSTVKNSFANKTNSTTGTASTAKHYQY